MMNFHLERIFNKNSTKLISGNHINISVLSESGAMTSKSKLRTWETLSAEKDRTPWLPSRLKPCEPT